MAACCWEHHATWPRVPQEVIDACVAEAHRVATLPVIKKYLAKIEDLQERKLADIKQYDAEIAILQRLLRKDYERLRVRT